MAKGNLSVSLWTSRKTNLSGGDLLWDLKTRGREQVGGALTAKGQKEVRLKPKNPIHKAFGKMESNSMGD